MEINPLYTLDKFLSTPGRVEPHFSLVSKKYKAEAGVINYHDNIISSAEELADVISSFGRMSKSSRRNDNSDNDFFSTILEDNADEKISLLIKLVSKFHDYNSVLNYTRQLFPDDWDLMQALRELLSRHEFTEVQKKRIKEALLDVERFGDQKKIKSSSNVNLIAKRFSKCERDNNLKAKDLRNNYLRFLELELPATFIYQDWIDEYGFHNRKRMLSFTFSALVADMKASEPGINYHEFGPLSTRLSDARILNTIDEKLTAGVSSLNLYKSIKNGPVISSEESFLNVFLTGLTNFNGLDLVFKKFSHDFMSLLQIRQQAMVLQTLRNAYNITPVFLYLDESCRDIVIDYVSLLLRELHMKEISLEVWKGKLQ